MTILNRLLQSLQKIKCSALDLIKGTLAAQRTLALSILSSGLVTMASSIHASPLLRITEVMSAGDTVDWFEVTNYGDTTATIAGYQMDDNSFAVGSSVPLQGITSISPGEAVVFVEGSATNASTFKTNWSLGEVKQVGYYSGSGVGLSSTGDGVTLFTNSSANGGTELAGPFGGLIRVSFGASTAGTSFYWNYDTSGASTTSSSGLLTSSGTTWTNAATTMRGTPASGLNADLTIGVSAPSSVLTNSNFDYTLTAGNQGLTGATGIVVNFTIPSGLIFVSLTGGSGFTGVNNLGTATFSGGAISAGASTTLKVTVTTATAATYTAPIGAAVIDPANTITEGNETNNSSSSAVSTLASFPTPIVSIAATDATAAEAATDPGTFRITRTGDMANALTVDYTISTGAGQSTSGDYTPTLSGSAMIAATQSFVDLTITPVDDMILEGHETVTLTVMDSASYDLSAPSTATVTIAENDTSVNLATYVRVGRYDLPEPTRTAPPTNNLLCQEASGVAYNWDTETLFIACDGGKSVTQVSKSGVLVDTMTLALGSSPQGTEFYDTEGITYIGGGQFVMSEERDRQLVKFTYVAGITLNRAATQTVKLGTFSPNEGTEGLSYDPQTSGYICLKEINPIGIFQTGVDFALGTATNGSPTTANSINLFDPSLLGMTDVADVFALSNLPALTGQPQSGNMLVLSQENARIINIDRTGDISSSLQIVSDPGNPLTVANQQHEGLTMDRDGVLYVVSENGGGDIDHPQLWVYAPSSAPNTAPTAVALNNQVNSILENTSTTNPIKVADIVVTDDGLGTNILTVSGTDATFFEITNGSLYIKAGSILDFETKTSYSLTVNVDDPTLGSTPDLTTNFSLAVTDVVNETTLPALIISEVAPWSSTSGLGLNADWFEVTNTGATAVDITGWKVDDNSNSFASALILNGITSIAPGESVIFIESAAPTAAIAAFKTLWFGGTPPAGLQIGTYTGSGIGLSSSGDAVNLYNATNVLQANVVFGTSPVGPVFATFNNGVGLNNATISRLSVVGVHGAFVSTSDSNEVGSPGTTGKLFISEVASWGSGATAYVADWFELTNNGARAVNIAGWKVDDNSNAFVTAAPFSGITSIAPGESVIFMETATSGDLASKAALFRTSWFGASPPVGLQIGSYSGGGIGLSSGGDAVNIFDANGTLVTGVAFGTATTNVSFDNKTGIGSNTLPLPSITTVSVTGTNGAFVATNAAETGSPGTTGKLIITEVAPWSSNSSPVLADWFEVTNTGASLVDITGWKIDDNSESPVAAVALSGITSIAPGESVIFIETATPLTTIPNFLSNWFGANPPVGLQVGSYTGSGIGLSSTGDAVNLYDTANTRQANVAFGASPAGAPFATFDNKVGLNFATISTLSAVGINGAFVAANSSNEAASPGSLINPPSVPTFSFANAAYSVREDAGVVLLTINRAGTFGAASINVSTANGTAIAGTDYTALLNQTVNFLANQTSATVNVTIANLAGIQASRTFTATLSNAVAGAPVSTTVTIIDNAVSAFAEWLASNGYAGSLGGDSDHDGAPDSLEYFFNTSPNNSGDRGNLPTLAMNGSDLEFRFTYLSGTIFPGYLQFSEDLINWANATPGVDYEIITETVNGVETAMRYRIFCNPAPTATGPFVYSVPLTAEVDRGAVGQLTISNLGMVGAGRISGDQLDRFGETMGASSGLSITNWGYNSGTATFTGIFNVLPDRGYNTGSIFSNYSARVHEVPFTFTPYYGSAAVPQNQIAMTFNTALTSSTTKFSYIDGATTKFTTGLNAAAVNTLFGQSVGTAPAANGPGGSTENLISFDAEAIHVFADGSGFVSDEYGAYIARFNSSKQFTRFIQLPDAARPRVAGNLNFDALAAPTNGRRNNQGIEGLSVSPDNSRLFALMQSALIQDTIAGNQSGRFNSRFFVYDIAGTNVDDPVLIGEHVVQLPRYDLKGNNSGIDTTASQSEIVAISNSQFLMLPRDGNGLGKADTNPPVTKTVDLVDISSATNILGLYDGIGGQIVVSGALRSTITPATSTVVVNLLSGTDLAKFGFNTNTSSPNQFTIPEKIEGMALVPDTSTASTDDYFLFIANDNDFQSSNVQMLNAAGTIPAVGPDARDRGIVNDALFTAWRIIICTDNRKFFKISVPDAP